MIGYLFLVTFLNTTKIKLFFVNEDLEVIFFLLVFRISREKKLNLKKF